MSINLNDKVFIKKEKEFYKQYRIYNYNVKSSKFKAFHDTIEYFKKQNFILTY